MEQQGNRRSATLRTIAYGGIATFVASGSILLFILYRQILEPLRGMIIKTGGDSEEKIIDEVDSLKHSLQSMIRDFDQTTDELARSRRNLLQAERMAVVGELAAGVAHTIRNPFTSIKMRMFSLSRSLELADAQNDDLRVITEEIGRIDKIVQNFLEFARPPKLRLEQVSLQKVVHSVLALLEYRLREYQVDVHYEPCRVLPEVRMDADRIKEALVNLIINGCEATGPGGRIVIEESLAHDEKRGGVAVICVADNGPGIADAIREQVTAPFFTTKDNGSGLGLSIVVRIAKEHGGSFTIHPGADGGATCCLHLPLHGGKHEPDPAD
jgi:signal transduction histidine kinase